MQQRPTTPTTITTETKPKRKILPTELEDELRSAYENDIMTSDERNHHHSLFKMSFAFGLACGSASKCFGLKMT